MLYIQINSITKQFNGTLTWHVGEKLPSFQGLPIDIYKNVYEVQADCDELDFILQRISGIPRSNNLVQRWFGDDAKFIVAFIENYVPFVVNLSYSVKS